MRLQLSRVYLWLFCIILVCGNALRIIPIQFLFGTVNAGEVILYSAEILIFPMYWKRLVSTPLYSFSILIVFASVFVGLLKWGYDPTAVLYAARLMMQVTGAALVGIALFELFACDVVALAVATTKLYFYLSVAALIILVAFPDSTVLWAALGESGVTFSGDPHSGRLVSTYFDPNFFSAIIAFPLTLAWGIYFRTRSVRVLFYAVVMLVADVMTFSRSGLALLVLVSGSLGLASINRRNAGSKVFKFSIVALFASALIVMLAVLLPDVTDRIVARFSTVSSDESALERLQSFHIGMNLIAEEPLGGFGYNYGFQPAVAANGHGIDSSFQVLFLNFGLIVSMFAIFICAVWFVNTGRIVGKEAEKDMVLSWKHLKIYFLLSVFWASNFNQLIFYVWWLMPVLGGMFYFDSYRRHGPSFQLSKPIVETSLPRGSAS
jgi:hypothetical protein